MKFFFIRGVIIVILLFVSIGAHAAKKADDWFTYKDPGIGYVIQYPYNWGVMGQNEKQPGWIVAGDIMRTGKLGNALTSIFVYVGKHSSLSQGTKTSLKAFAESTRTALTNILPAGQGKTLESLRSWGKVGPEGTLGWGYTRGGARMFVVFFFHGDLAYTVGYRTTALEKSVPTKQLRGYLERSLKSFKFPITKPRAGATVEWKSTALGIKLSHPEGWVPREFLETEAKSILFTDPKPDLVAVGTGGLRMRINAQVAVNQYQKVTDIQQFIDGFTAQSKKEVVDYTTVSPQKNIRFKNWSAIEMVVTYRLSPVAGTPTVRSRVIFLPLADKTFVLYDRSVDATYAQRKTTFDTILNSFTLVSK